MIFHNTNLEEKLGGYRDRQTDCPVDGAWLEYRPAN